MWQNIVPVTSFRTVHWIISCGTSGGVEGGGGGAGEYPGPFQENNTHLALVLTCIINNLPHHPFYKIASTGSLLPFHSGTIWELGRAFLGINFQHVTFMPCHCFWVDTLPSCKSVNKKTLFQRRRQTC